MRPAARSVVKRAGLALGGLAALGTAFTFGVVAGAGSAPDVDPSPRSAGVLDDAAAQIVASGLKPVDRTVLDAAAIRAMLAASGDEWGSWTDAPAAPGGPGSYAGVGLSLRRQGNALVVAEVTAGSPAAGADVAVGDELRAVDDASVRGRAGDEVTASLRGRPGSAVALVLRHGTTLRSMVLVRAQVVPVVSAVMVSPTVGRITVPVFARGTGHQVRDALARLTAAHATGIVLDVRGDPGGLLSEAVETAGAFLDGGTVVTYARRDEAPQALRADSGGETRTPLVVLVDGGTASAAEVVAGSLQERGRAVLVGSRTFGKGSVQEPRVLPDGSSLALTVARYSLPSGRSVEGIGIEPDISVGSGSYGPDDPVVGRALQVLSGLLADSGGGSRG